MESFSHILAFASETNTISHLQDPHGPIKHLDAYVNDRVQRSEDKYKGLLGMLSSHYNNLHPSIKEYLTSSNMIDIPETKSIAGGNTFPSSSSALCGVLTRSKKPCTRPGSTKYDGRCGHHKNVALRVNSIETTEVVVEPASVVRPVLGTMNLVPDEEVDAPVPLNVSELGVHDAEGNMLHDTLEEWEDVEEDDLEDDLEDFVEYD